MTSAIGIAESGLSFDAAAISDAGAQTGVVFAVAQGLFGGHDVSCDLRYSGTITAIDVRLQGAMNDVDAQYRDIGSSTAVGGETIQVRGNTYRFLRVKKVTSTTSSTPKITAEIAVSGSYNVIQTALTGLGGLFADPSALDTPSAPTVTSTGGVATTYSYKIIARFNNIGTDPSSAGTTTTGAATLDGTHYNTITWPAVTGATSYDVYRTDGPGDLGFVGNTTNTSLIDNVAALSMPGDPNYLLNRSNQTGQLSADSLYLGIPSSQIHFNIAPFAVSPDTALVVAADVTSNSADIDHPAVLFDINVRPNSGTVVGLNINMGIFTGALAHSGDSVVGISQYITPTGSGNLLDIAGQKIIFDGEIAAGTIRSFAGVLITEGFMNAGVLTTFYGLRVQKQIAGATNYQLYLDDEAAGANDWAIYSAGGKSKLDTLIIGTHVPANASAAGIAGQITWDGSFIYVCTSTNTWKRAAIATW